MKGSRIKLAVGALLLALAADMLDAPQIVPWTLVVVGLLFVIWGIWPQVILQCASKLPKGQFIAEKLHDFGAWIDGVASFPFDVDVAAELGRMHDLGHEMLSRCPYLIGGPNYDSRRQEWDKEAKEWMQQVAGYIAENITRSEAYMFSTYSRARPRQLDQELRGKLEKLRLINGRYMERENGER